MTPKITITTVWKENKAIRRRKKEELIGALRREGDQRLGDKNALRMCAQQSENLKSEWGKSEEKAQHGVYIGRAHNTSQWRGRKPNKPSFNATLVPFRFANCQIMMTVERTARNGTLFESALMDASTTQFCPLEFSTKPLALWVPWFVPKNRARIKGGLLYGPKKPQPH